MEGFDFNFTPPETPSANANRNDGGATAGGGGWHWVLTLMSLLIVSGLSFLMAYLTKDVTNRPVWMMGLIFAVPMAAMFFSNLLVESQTQAMTPSYVRRSQLLVAILATVGTFLIGSMCDLVYLTQFSDRNTSADTVFVLDKSDSMGWYGENEKMIAAVEECLEQMDQSANVGVVLFDAAVMDVVPVGPLSSPTHYNRVLSAVNAPLGGGTAFEQPLTEAFNAIEAFGSGKPIQIIFLTDGGAAYSESTLRRHIGLSERLNVTVNAVNLGASANVGGVKDLTDATGGTVVNADDAATLVEVFNAWTFRDGDMLRANETMANVMTGVMFILEGVVIGVGLWLMLSVRGQFRVQTILSPVMGVAALVLIKFSGFTSDMADWWMLEGVAFSLLGVVFMVKNRVGVQPVMQPTTGMPEQGDGFDSGFGAADDGLGF